MPYADIEKRRTAARRRYAENPTAQRASNDKWKKDHPEKHNENTRMWRLAHPDAREMSDRRGNLQRKGLTPEKFAEILASQRGVCAICGSDNPGGTGNFRIDHDHSCCPGSRSCGVCVRGLLCNGCNSALGHMHDDPARLRAAASYLEGK